MAFARPALAGTTWSRGTALRFTGKLHTWNEERGFGFIRPADGGQDVFVHVSSLPGGRRPPADEVLTFEIATDREGRKKAVHVRLQAAEVAGLAADRQRDGGRRTMGQRQRETSGRRGSTGIRTAVIALVALCGLSFYAYQQRTSATPQAASMAPAELPDARPAAASSFSCDGRTQCSQMRSCEEAKYFLKNCPGVQMDGDRDGVPCEQQWCTW